MHIQKISPFLWFDNNCEEAVNFYTSLFPNSKILNIQHYPTNVDEPHMKGMNGKVINAIFELDGFKFMALDGGPIFKPNPSISFFVNFDPSKEKSAKEDLDKLWDKLSEEGEILMPLQEYPFSKHYGWVQDKYGISWQLILSDPNGEDRPAIIPSLLFVGDSYGKAEEAMKLYTALFKDSKIGTLAKYPAGMEPDQEGKIMYGDFMIANQWFSAMDSGMIHKFNFNEAISFYVECEDQKEVDYFWEKLTTDGGEESQCGWLKDKYGVSWQIIPKQLGDLISKDKTGKVMELMLKMQKIIIKDLESAAS